LFVWSLFCADFYDLLLSFVLLRLAEAATLPFLEVWSLTVSRIGIDKQYLLGAIHNADNV
jgi:hypothetical protein